MIASSSKQPLKPIDGRSSHLFSCQSCYQRKVKCDRGNPCTYCSKHKLKCIASIIETTERPRKRRFAEAELLAKIKKYEAALLSYGADPEEICTSDIASLPSPKQPTMKRPRTSYDEDDIEPSFTNAAGDSDEYHQVWTILDGKENNTHQAGQMWYDRVFTHDTSSLLFAVEPSEVPGHPAPFDMFKLWQVYCDNVHPLNKLLHAPTFQRKMSSYGSHLHLAPAADQALFFAIYVAAITSLSPGECEMMFFTAKDSLLEQYKLATQIWLRRANIWRTSDLAVLQSFILFLSSIQNLTDPRTVACFTAVADRIARRMSLHNSNKSPRNEKPIDREMRTRVWWELILLDSKAVERAGLGTGVMAGNWSVRLPSGRSDADLERLEETSALEGNLQPSSEMLCFLVRAETASFLATLRSQRQHNSLVDKMKKIDAFERRLQFRYLCFCDKALPLHRLTSIFTQAIISRMRISACLVEESCKDQSTQRAAGLELVKHCSCNLEAYCQMRNDDSLVCFKWFMLQNLPIFAYIHLLRLLQTHVSGIFIDRAWQAVQDFKNTGIKIAADSLTLGAWKARKAASSVVIEDPPFIKEMLSRHRADVLPHISKTDSSPQSSAPSSDYDFMALLAEMMSGEASSDFDWPS